MFLVRGSVVGGGVGRGGGVGGGFGAPDGRSFMLASFAEDTYTDPLPYDDSMETDSVKATESRKKPINAAFISMII